MLVLGLPLLGSLMLALFGARRFAAELNVGVSLATLAAGALLVVRVIKHGPILALREQFFVDSFNVFLVALTAFVGFTTAVFSRPYMRIEEHHGRVTSRRLRLYHSMYQLFMAAMFLALLTNNMGLLWVAMEAATLSTVVLVAGSIGTSLPSHMLMVFGLLSAVLGAFFLWRQRDIKRLFGYSSIEHMGIITFAFGMGGPVANFAALLHMTVHSLTKSSIFFTAGHASQAAGTQRMDDIRGMLAISPTIGWGLVL